MRKFIRVALGCIYFLSQVAWFFIVSVPLAILLYSFLHVAVFIKSIYNQIKSVWQTITT